MRLRIPPRYTETHLGLEEQPHIVDRVTVLTPANLSFIVPS